MSVFEGEAAGYMRMLSKLLEVGLGLYMKLNIKERIEVDVMGKCVNGQLQLGTNRHASGRHECHREVLRNLLAGVDGGHAAQPITR